MAAKLVDNSVHRSVARSAEPKALKLAERSVASTVATKAVLKECQ